MAIRKKNKIEVKKSMLLLCATDAETVFFNQLRKDCRYSSLTVQKSTASSLEKLISEAGALRNKGKYSSVWCAFGLDELSVTVEDVARAEESAARKKVRMLYFEPSFDLYFALFLSTLRKPSSKADLERIIRGEYPDYELTSSYFLRDGINMNFRIYPRLAVADQNARLYNSLMEDETGFRATTLSEFFTDLKDVCGAADMSQTRSKF